MALIRCPNCGRIALGYKVAAEDAVAVSYTMGRVMPDVCLCAVILLLANGISSSTSLRIQSRQSDHFKGSQETTAAVKTCEEIKDTCEDATGCTCKDQAGQIALLANKIVVRFKITKNAARHRRDTAEQNCTVDLTELVKMIKKQVPNVIEDSIKCTGDDVAFEVFAENAQEVATDVRDALKDCGQNCPLGSVSFSGIQKTPTAVKTCEEINDTCKDATGCTCKDQEGQIALLVPRTCGEIKTCTAEHGCSCKSQEGRAVVVASRTCVNIMATCEDLKGCYCKNRNERTTLLAFSTCDEMKYVCKNVHGCTCRGKSERFALLVPKTCGDIKACKIEDGCYCENHDGKAVLVASKTCAELKLTCQDVNGCYCKNEYGRTTLLGKSLQKATTCQEIEQECQKENMKCEMQLGKPVCVEKFLEARTCQEKEQECEKENMKCEMQLGKPVCVEKILEEARTCQEKEQECEKENKKCEMRLGKPVCVADPVPLAVAPGKERIQEGCSCNCNCPSCATVESSANGVAVKNVSLKEQGMTPETADVYEKLGALMPLKERVDSLLQVKGMVTALQASLQHISEKHDKVIYHLGSIDNEVASLKLRIARVEMFGMNRKISELQKQLSDYNEHLTKQTLMIN